MSYLNGTRLHFAGRFQANVSTVNNDPGHFDNATFQPGYQQLQGAGMNPPNGWFNPEGDAAWRFLGCNITSAWMNGQAVAATDPVLGFQIADSNNQAPAKLVDLDPEQQLVSTIWGLQVRVVDGDGNTLLLGDFEPAAFIDIWDRAMASSGGDADAGAMYQSVLTNLRWSNVALSPFLVALQAAASDGLLSIKFNVDAFNLSFSSPDFMTGRITGTIGPASASEPKHLVVGRQFMASSDTTKPANFFRPAGGINFCAAVVDPTVNCIYLDLGNALYTGAGGSILNVGDLTLSMYDPLLSSQMPPRGLVELGVVPSTGTNGYAFDPSWYSRTAGVVTLPISANDLPRVQQSTLFLTGNASVVISESPGGAFVRADQFVHRMSPGDSVTIPFYATQYGQPLLQVGISFVQDASGLQSQVGAGFPFVMDSPPVSTPPNAIAFAGAGSTDKNGVLNLVVTASDPGTPRNFGISPSNPTGDYGIDGQVYGIRASFSDAAQYGNNPVNPWNFVSFLVWSSFTSKMPNAPTWYDDVQPMFQQYANLYPVMNRFLNLGNYNDVLANVRLLQLAFGLDPSNPNSMPVTRDLSPAKRRTILAWLANPIAGTPPAVRATARTANPSTAPNAASMKTGGKAMAAARRLALQPRLERGQS